MPVLSNRLNHTDDTQPIAIEQQQQKPRALTCRLLLFIAVTNVVTLILAVCTTLWIIKNPDIVSDILPAELAPRAPQTLPSQEAPTEFSPFTPIPTSEALASAQRDAAVQVATPTNAATITPTAAPTDTPVPTDTDTPVPADTDTPVPTDTDTPVPTDTDTPVPTDTPTATSTTVPTSMPTAVPREIHDFPETICAEGAVNLRQGAGYTAFEVAGQIFPGMRYKVVGAVEGESVYGNTTWYRVSHAGRTAYVTAQYTRPCSAQPQSQPQVQQPQPQVRQPQPQVQQPQPQVRQSQPQVQQPQPQPKFTCPSRPSCGNVSSCEEAHFIWKQCGYSRADGDGDGVPCERVCPGG